MFGQNPQRAIDHGDGQSLAVQSIFYTLQGEGPFAGRPAVFIRLAGCNLACTFCDTDFESGIDNRLTTDSICVEVLRSYGDAPIVHGLVVLTGGEPLRQNIAPLIARLIERGYQVQIETAGTIGVPDALHALFHRYDQHGEKQGIDQLPLVIVCSPKTPKIQPSIEAYCRNWKYIVRANDVSIVDGLPVASTQQKPENDGSHRIDIKNESALRPLYRRKTHDPRWDDVTWLSPCDEQDPVKNAANLQAAVKSCLEFGHRLTLQMHKIVSLP